jgi:hypothetical protein
VTWKLLYGIWLIGMPIAFTLAAWFFWDRPGPVRKKILLVAITTFLWPAELIVQLWRLAYDFWRALGRVGADLSRGIR